MKKHKHNQSNKLHISQVSTDMSNFIRQYKSQIYISPTSLSAMTSSSVQPVIIEHPYFKTFFNKKKQQLLVSIDSIPYALFVKYGLIKTIIAILFKNTIQDIELQHATFSDLNTAFEKIITTAYQFREFCLKIDRHTADPRHPLPPGIEEVGYFKGGLFTLYNASLNDFSDQKIQNILLQIKTITTTEYTDLPIEIPEQAATLDQFFETVINQISQLQVFDINEFINISLAEFTIDVETEISAQQKNLIAALKQVYQTEGITKADKKNAAYNALYLNAQLENREKTHVYLDSKHLMTVLYLLQNHYYKDLPTEYPQYSEMYQFLKALTELNYILDDYNQVNRYPLRHALIIKSLISLFSEAYLRDPVEQQLNQHIMDALNDYLVNFKQDTDLLTYINHIIVNAAIYNEEYNADNKQKNKSSNRIEEIDNDEKIYELKDNVKQTVTNIDTVNLQNVGPIENIAESFALQGTHLQQKPWQWLTQRPDWVSLEYKFTGQLGERIYVAWTFLKALKKVEKKELQLAQKSMQSPHFKLCEYLREIGSPYLTHLLNNVLEEQFLSRLSRLFSNDMGIFSSNNLPADICEYFEFFDGGFKNIVTQTFPPGYLTTTSSLKLSDYLSEQSKTAASKYVIGFRPYSKLDAWLRHLYQICERKLLMINGELRPEFTEALGESQLKLAFEKFGKENVFSYLLAAFFEAIGGYWSEKTNNLPEFIQLPYKLSLHYLNRIQQSNLMKYSAIDDLAQLLKILLFTSQYSINNSLKNGMPYLQNLLQEVQENIDKPQCLPAKDIKLLFSSLHQHLADWPLTDTDQDPYINFIAVNKEMLLAWLTQNEVELTQPCLTHQMEPLPESFISDFLQSFEQDLLIYYRTQPSLMPMSENVIHDERQIQRNKEQPHNFSFYQQRLTTFNVTAPTTIPQEDATIIPQPEQRMKNGNRS